jgi:hypothetical protein
MTDAIVDQRREGEHWRPVLSAPSRIVGYFVH